MPERVAQAIARYGATPVDAGQITSTPCDVFVPCAMGGVLTDEVAASLPARGVCGAANNVFASDAAAITMHRRGVLVVPDFVANAGALIQGALWNLNQERVGPERVRRIGDTARQILTQARQQDVPPSVLAVRVAEQRLAAARMR